MMLAQQALADIQSEQERKALADEVTRLRSLQEKLRLEEEIAHSTELREEHLAQLRLEASQRTQKLVEAMQPRQPAPPPVSRTAKAMRDEQERRGSAAAGRVTLVMQFTDDINAAFKSKVSDTTKALCIKAILDTYDCEVADLPKVVREFLERVAEEER